MGITLVGSETGRRASTPGRHLSVPVRVPVSARGVGVPRGRKWNLRTIRNVLLARLIRGAEMLLGTLPLGAALHVGGALGAGACAVLARDRRRALEHLRVALPELPERERARLVLETFRNSGKSFAELAQWRRVRHRLGRLVTIDGVGHLQRGLALGRGLIAVTGHIGNWELLGATMAQLGYPLSVVARRVNDDRFDRLIRRFRARAGVHTIRRDDTTALRYIARILRAGGILALLIDQDTRGPGVFVPFFGSPARTSPGAALIALRTRAPVVAAFIERRPHGHHIRIEPLYGFSPPTGRRPSVEQLTGHFTAAIEAQIRRSPAEWVWWHRRWRHQPPKERVSGTDRVA